MSSHRSETQREVEAALAARAELGADYDDHIAAGLADRVEQLVALRTAELRHADETSHLAAAETSRTRTQRFVLGIISLGAAIPISAIALVQGGIVETVVCWAGIVGVNGAVAWGDRNKKS